MEDTRPWYDEPKLLKEIEKRLGSTVTPLGPNYELPESFGVRGKDAYGKARDEQVNEELNAHLEAYAPHVKSARGRWRPRCRVRFGNSRESLRRRSAWT